MTAIHTGLAILLSTRLNAAQKNLSKKLLGEKNMEGYSRGWIDSPKMKFG